METMNDTLQTSLAVWGAALSSLLVLKALLESVRDKPKINVSADITFIPCDEDKPTKGTKIHNERSGWSEILIRLKASNSGSKSLQIVSVYVDEEKTSHQIFPENIPVVLEPRTQLKTTIQKEWIDKSNILSLGVLDALGKRHPIGKSELKELMLKSNALPTNRNKYRNKTTGEEVEAFQAKDVASINSQLN